MTRKILRWNKKRFCHIEIKLEDGRLSVCGIEGRIVTRAQAKKEALAYWTSYFEEDWNQITELNKRFDKHFTRPSGAAKFVLETDGELHGLDVLKVEGGDEQGPASHDSTKIVLITESYGQIREELAEWFPEYVPLFAYHLNDLHAECEHQQARDETWQTRPNAVCPDCGYKLGSAWLKRDLPPEIVKLAEGVP